MVREYVQSPLLVLDDLGAGSLSDHAIRECNDRWTEGKTREAASNHRSSYRMKLLTTKAVSELFSVPAGTLRYWRKVGLGPAWVKLEGSIRYAEEDVLRYIEQRRRIPSVRAYMEERDAV